MNSVITIVLSFVVAYLAVQAFGWIAGEEWEIIRVNLRNFMVGQFPSDELWRLWTSAYILIATFAIGTSAMGHNSHDDAIEQGLVTERSSLLDLLRRFWAVLAFIGLMVSFAETFLPVLGVLAGIGVLVVSRIIGWALPPAIRSRSVSLMAVGTVLAMAILAGTGGPCRDECRGGRVGDIGGRPVQPIRRQRLQVDGNPRHWTDRHRRRCVADPRRDRIRGLRLGGMGGLHLTLFATVVGITAGLPIGILLAIGRRSQLPVIKGFCVIFIEFVRGVPLISLLLFSSFILPLLFPLSVETPETLTRAMIVISLFSAAYIAEIVRGGLQAVPTGQTEAAQASGMSAAKIQRLIVMPQALRAVIPAMVGQFISLFKDTSLIATIGVAEYFQYGAIANSQPDFLGKGLQLVTYSVIAVGYWSVRVHDVQRKPPPRRAARGRRPMKATLKRKPAQR